MSEGTSGSSATEEQWETGDSTPAGGTGRAAELYRLQLDAQARGDTALADRYQSQQTELAVLHEALFEAQGYPKSAPVETSQVGDPKIEIYRQFYAYMEKQGVLDQVLERHDLQGMGVEFDQMVMQPYKERNSSPLLQERPGMTDAERIEMMQQREPVVVDPNWIANMRQRLVKLDQEMKGIDENFSVYRHPKTRRLANWIAREVGPETPGYVQSGEQGYEEVGESFGMMRGFAEGVTGFGLNMLFGTVDLAAKAVKSIVGEEYGLPWAVATNYVEDENGNLVNNGGKVPGFVQTIAAVNARVMGQNVNEYIAYVDKAQEFEQMKQAGFDRILQGTAAVVGMGFGFGLPAGAAMRGGQMAFAPLTQRGLMRLAAGGASPRMVKLAGTLASVPGAMVGNGLAEGLAFGRAEGYSSAFVHGMAMAPVLMGLGWLGRKSESVLTRKKMPEGMARAISGALEGVGFGTLEAGQTGALWKLMSDPSNETWEIYAKNMLGFAIFKGAFGRSVTNAPEFGEAVAANVLRQRAREALAEEVSRAEERALMERADLAIEEQMRREQEMRRREAAESEQGPEPELTVRGDKRRQALEEELQERMDIYNDDPDSEGRMTRDEALKEAIQDMDDPESLWYAHRRALQDEGIERGFYKAYTKEELAERVFVSRGKKYDFKRGDKYYRWETWGELEPEAGMEMREGEREARREQEAARQQAEMDEIIKRRRAERLARGPESGVEKAEKELARRKQGIEVFKARPKEQQKPETWERLQRKLAEAEEGLERAKAEEQRLDEEMGELGMPPPSSRELAEEIQRARAAGPSPENRARIEVLIEGTRTGEDVPTRADLEARILESGVPKEILRELGDISRARKAARSPQEAAKLYQRQLELEMELDALEMAQDPVMNATLREQLRELEVREMDEPLEAKGQVITSKPMPPGEVDPIFGERYGPESLRKAANPFRHQENLLEPGEEPLRASDIIAVLKGRPGFPGVRIFGRRLGSIPGSAVNIAILRGRIKALGVFKQYENLTRTQEGMDLIVALHEWAHAMQRQVHIGVGGTAFGKGVRKWLQAQTQDVLVDALTILRTYPGAEKLSLWRLGAEAWAEWHARNLLGDPTLRTEVPHLSRVMDAWLKNNPQLLPQYQEIQGMLDIYKRQGARLRLRMASQRGPARKQGSLVEQVLAAGEGVWDRVVKSFFDDMHLLKKSQRKWLRVSKVDPGEISILSDPARLYDVVAMTASKQAESLLTRGMHTLGLKRTGEPLLAIINDVGKGLKGAAKNEKTIDFIDYIVATRALDLIAKGKKQTLPKSDYLQAKKELLAINPEFAGLAKRLKVWTDGLLDLVAEAGNVPPADVQRMKDYSVVYLPFVRAMEGAVQRRGNRGVAEKGNALKELKGDTQEIQDPMQAMFEVTTTMIAKAHQQMVMKALYKMMLSYEVGGMATRVDRTNVPSRFRYDQVLRAMEGPTFKALRDRAAAGDVEAIEQLELVREAFNILGELVKEGELTDDLVTLFGQKLMPYGEGANIVAYTPRLTTAEIQALPPHARYEATKYNGKMQWMELDEHTYSALMGLDQPVGPTFMDNTIMKVVFGVPKKVLRFFATDANPAFVAANAIRDITSVSVFDREGKVAMVPLVEGLMRFIQGAAVLAGRTPENREIADMFVASGANTASIYNEGVRREMRGEVANMRQRIVEPFLKARDRWTSWMAGPESFIRVHEFKRVYQKAIGEGKGEVEAAMLALEGAKEITVNFARAGTIARAYNQMTPYFSASFAGQRKLFRALTGMEGTNDAERGRMQAAALMNGITAITMPAMAAWLLVKDEDWYKDLPEWRKRHFINMKLPTSDTIISLPLPFELGTIFGTMPQIFADGVTDSNPIPFFETFAESLFPYLRGVGSLLPAGAKPILEAASGYDFFTQRELTPYYIEQNNPPAEQMRPGTTITSQAFFKVLQNVGIDYFLDNPIEFEQILSSYTAGASTAFSRWVDETMSLKDHPGMQPGLEVAYGAFLNRFARQTVHGASRAVDEFYTRLAPSIEQRARNETTRTPALRRSLRLIQRDKERMSDIRRQVRIGELTRAEGDRLIYEVARDALEREAK